MQKDWSQQWPVYSRYLFHHETDADGVCHFSNYFRICEEALFEGLRTLKFKLEESDLSFAIVHTSADYKVPLRFNERFQMTLRTLKVRRAKFELNFSIATNECDENAALILGVVCISRQSKSLVPIAPELKSLLVNVELGLTPSTALVPGDLL